MADGSADVVKSAKLGVRYARLRVVFTASDTHDPGDNGREAKDEFLFAATAQNLRKLAKVIPMPQPAIA